MELQHFSHPHPLLLSLDGSIVDHDHGFDWCRLCRERVSSGTPCYGCKLDGCNYIVLHKSCAELPHQLKHPFHPKHDPLTLRANTESCDSCGRRPWPVAEYEYTCSGCKFKLCIKCASLSLTTKVDIHDHPLTLMRKSTQFICDHCEKEGKGIFYFCATATCSFTVHPECTLSPLVVRPPIIKAEIHDDDHPLTLAKKLISFTCDACGKDGRGMFYICAECSFVVHLDCASLPLVLKVIRHDHPLNLIYSLPAINPSNLQSVCQLCVNMVETDYMVYHCSTCDFVAHIYCASSKEEKDETFMQKSKDEESIEPSTSMLEHGIDESTDMLPYVVKKFKPGVDGQIEIATEIIHFSHEHDLKLTDKFGINKKCDACTRYIFTPYYACAQCRFFLHKSCAELRRRMRHPLHLHPLMLLPRAISIYGSFGCNVCDRDCNGFTYKCEECDFDLDVQCSLLPYNKFTHDSHEHGLILSRSQEGRKCNNCDSKEGFKFWCADNCGFALDFKCLTLPHRVWYEQHEHPFTLCYALEDDLGEYYCDICEKERDPRCWFYYCADCIYPAHLECILEKFPFPNIKFERTIIIDNHQHPLAFVQKTSDDGRDLCKVCPYGFRDQDLAYECAECNFSVHEWCLSRIGTSKG